MRSTVVLVLLLCAICFAKVKTFQGNQVLRVTPQTQEHLELLVSHRLTNQLDFWSEATVVGQPVDIHISGCTIKAYKKELEDAGLNYTIFISDVQKLVTKQKEPSADWLASYHTYEDVMNWLSNLPRRFPHLVTLVNIGKSYEQRNLVAVKISSGKSSNPVGAWFDGGIHAREWITVATTLWMTNQLLLDYGKDPVVTALIDNMVITVLPIFNPDGYSYTWSDDRMWRKTRSPNQNSDCIGTDPNRNWDFHWGEAGSSSDPCDDSFMGANAFSEVEVRTVANYIKVQGNIKGYINFHSYSQLWMSPWGWTDAYPKDYNTQNALSAACTTALTKVYGTQYQYGPIATTIYPASGSSADWTYGVANVLYSYGVELRDTGTYGFLLPPDQIVPSGQETYQALKVWLQQVRKVKV